MSRYNINKLKYNKIVRNIVSNTVKYSLIEDIGTNDVSASLVDQNHVVHARVVTREFCVLCGTSWVNEIFKKIDEKLELVWLFNDGDIVLPNQVIFHITGYARAILTGERVALNFLQTLSAISTKTYKYVYLISHTKVKIRDTRKTIPGLRFAQKYAVFCGGGFNHRIGLFDLFLIKENHIVAFKYNIGSIFDKLHYVDNLKEIEIEVENINQLLLLDSKVDAIMLDNFIIEDMKKAVKLISGKVALEVSGNILMDNIVEIAETGINFISIGDLTKNVTAVDLSMRFMW
jgi:nicotinate-nucleotide pyrophosphorylase (carboxylating)